MVEEQYEILTLSTLLWRHERIKHRIDLSPLFALDHQALASMNWYVPWGGEHLHEISLALAKTRYTRASEITCMLIQTNIDHREKEKKNKIKVHIRIKNKIKIIPLLISTMAEKKEVHRCHAQYNPLSLFKIKRNPNYKTKREKNPKKKPNFGPLLDAGRSVRCTAGSIYRCRRLQSPG